MSSADKNSLLFVGRLQPRKRIDLIIRAFSELQQRIADNIVLDIVGGGLLDDELRQLADKLGIAQKVIFHGPVQDHAELASVFSRAYAYVSPGRHGPEFKNLSHNQNALILESEEHLGPALEWICNHPEAVQVLGHNAYLQYSQNRTLNHMLAGFRKAIEE
jgi:glycosyltransferase involved in cell wall biosynthesis